MQIRMDGAVAGGTRRVPGVSPVQGLVELLGPCATACENHVGVAGCDRDHIVVPALPAAGIAAIVGSIGEVQPVVATVDRFEQADQVAGASKRGGSYAGIEGERTIGIHSQSYALSVRAGG